MLLVKALEFVTVSNRVLNIMQLFNALLAGFFLWLTFYVHFRRSAMRSRQWAGKSVLQVPSSIGLWRYREGWIGILFFGSIFIGNIIKWLHSDYFSFNDYCSVSLTLFLVMLFLIPVGKNILIEVRQRGLIYRWPTIIKGLPIFYSWRQKKEFHWSYVESHKGDHLYVWEKLVSPEDKAAVTAALGRFIPVYETDGVLLAKSDASEHKNQEREPETPPRFQFDLLTLLIFVVFAACVANGYGLEYRRLQPQNEAVTRLMKFSPTLCRSGGNDDDVWHLTFAFSPPQQKPTDADMDDVALFSELSDLDIAGAQITDAGLEKIKNLKHLRKLDLRGTAVTDAGVERLQKALPHAKIIR
jgi:hypothetical protein